MGLDAVGLGCENRSPIRAQLRNRLPSLDDRPRSPSHYFGIRQQAKQAHLGYPAEGHRSVGLCREPVTRRHVVAWPSAASAIQMFTSGSEMIIRQYFVHILAGNGLDWSGL